MFAESRIGQQIAVYFHEQRIRIVADRRFITCLLPDQIKGQLMECIAAQALDSHSFGQLGGSLVRIADKKNPCRIDFLYFNQVFDLSYDGGCLAASGTAYDQTIILFLIRWNASAVRPTDISNNDRKRVCAYRANFG